MSEQNDPFNRFKGERKGGTRKIAELPNACNHPEHNPPMHMVYENGIWEHICPACGNLQIFTVNKPTL